MDNTFTCSLASLRARFGNTARPIAHNDNREKPGRDHLAWFNATRRVNGYNPTSTQVLHGVIWEDPDIAGRFHTGLLFEDWAYGTLKGGVPDMRLMRDRTFDDFTHAMKHRDDMIRDNTFGTLKSKIFPASTQVADRPEDLPFARPRHWREYAAARAGFHIK